MPTSPENPYIAAQREANGEQKQRRKRKRRQRNRLLIGFIGICIGVVLCTTGLAVAGYGPCIYNYYQLMPQHPDGIIIDETRSTSNWIGLGDINTTWQVDGDRDTVKAWYDELLIEQRRLNRRAIIEDREPPPVWGGIYRVEAASDNTSRVLMQPACFYDLRNPLY